MQERGKGAEEGRLSWVSRWAWRWPLALASGALGPWGMGQGDALSTLAGVASGALLALCLRGAGPKLALLLGLAHGGSWFGVLSLGVLHAMRVEMQLGMPGSLAFVSVLVLALALPTALWAVAASRCLSDRQELRMGAALWLSALWTALEFARAHLGGPLALLAHTQSALLTLQVADLGGAYMVSFVACISGLALSETACRVRRVGLPALRSFGAVSLWLPLVVSLGYGSVRLVQYPEPGSGTSGDQGATARVGLVQPAVAQADRWSRSARGTNMRTLLTHTQALPEASLVAWPETALAAFAERGLPFQLSYALKKGPELIAGALRSERTAGKTHRYNAAYHARGGEVLASYDKRYRMPFVESDPFGELPLLARFWGAQRTPYAAGTRAVVFDTVAGRVAPILCIEASEASLVRSSVRAGAQWLLVMSNDAWFGDSLANRVLAQLSRFRAVENRRDVVRVANLGVGGFIDAAGRARWVDDRNGPLHAQGEVTLRSEQTPYTRYGDVFAWLCAACALGVLLLNMWRMWSRRRNGRGRGSGEAARGL